MLVIDLVNGITVISFVCTMISIMYVSSPSGVIVSAEAIFVIFFPPGSSIYKWINDTANLSAMKGFISFCSNFITIVKS